MGFKERWLRCLPAGFLLAAVVLAAVWLAQPRGFSRIAPVDESTEFHIYTTRAGAFYELREARPEKEEIRPLLELLRAGSVQLKGRSRMIRWESGDTLYHLSFYHEGDSVWLQDAEFALCTDGMVYVPHDWLGYVCYRLVGCDVETVDAELRQILGMAQQAAE